MSYTDILFDDLFVALLWSVKKMAEYQNLSIPVCIIKPI